MIMEVKEIKYKGSVKQNSNGKWEFVVDIGKDPFGKRKQKRRKGFKTEKEAEESLKRVVESYYKNNPVLMYKYNKDNLQYEGLKGFSGEHIVISNLILKGLIPFSSQVPSSVVDIVALYHDKTYRIQVKTSEFGNKDFIHINNIHKYNENDFDILAIVDIETNNVAYLEWKDYYFKSSLYLYKINNSNDKNLLFGNFLSFPY